MTKEKPASEMVELCGKTIDEYSKEELWVVIEDFLKPEIKTEDDLNRDVEFFIDSSEVINNKYKKISLFLIAFTVIQFFGQIYFWNFY